MEDIVAFAQAALREPQGQRAWRMACDGHIIASIYHPGKHGRGIHRLDEHRDPHLVQLLLHQRRQTGAVGGTGELVGLSGVAPLFQQSTGLLHIPAPGHRGGIAGSGRQVGGGRLPHALGGLETKALLIQRQIHGPAHLRAGDGLVIEHQLEEGVGHFPFQHRQARLAGQFGVLHRHAASEGVIIQVPGNE